MIYEALYAVIAFLGLTTYILQGWKKSGQLFDWSLYIDALVSSGVVSVLTAALGLAAAGFSVFAFFIAFFLPWGVEKGMNSGIALAKKSQ
jgi:hypothetical protein